MFSPREINHATGIDGKDLSEMQKTSVGKLIVCSENKENIT